MPENKVYYVVLNKSMVNNLDIVSLMDYMRDGFMYDIVKPGTKDECQQFSAQYTKDNPYIAPAAAKQEEINKAKQHAGKDLGTSVKRDYILNVNQVLTEEEKKEVLSKAFEDAGYVLHAAYMYTGETRTIDCEVTAKSGEKYEITIKPLPSRT